MSSPTTTSTSTAAGIIKRQPVQYASVLAHEVRNPLATINLSVEMLAELIKDNDLRLYLDIIMRSSVRINDLINELLKYQPATELQAAKYSIHPLLDEVLEMAKDRITLKNITVIKDYGLQDCKIVLHRMKMKIALTNIIINAIDAMPAKKGELRLSTKTVDGNCVVYIQDNGCGISKINLKNIFKPFFTGKPGGLGIGLATTYDILRSNNIGVKVASKQGKGTCFTLLFDHTRDNASV